MRMYGKRFLRNSMEGKVRERTETRDAMIWEIYTDERYCIVKVAGSDALIRAWFPRNTDRIPPWLKIGMTARIAHVGGDRSRIEVTGHGLVIPAPISGGYIPPVPIGDDAPMTGGGMTQTPTPGQSVMIYTGTYRIGGVIYSFDSDTSMGEGGQWFMGEGGSMAGSYLVMPTDPITGGVGDYRFRYDIFVIGIDGEVHYIKGDEWEYVSFYTGGSPTIPLLPAEHIMLGQPILRYSGKDVVESQDIGRIFVMPRPVRLELTNDIQYYIPWNSLDDSGSSYPRQVGNEQSETSMSYTEQVSVYDQYDNPASWSATGQMNELEFSYNPTSSQWATGWIAIPGVGTVVPGESASVSLGMGYQFSFSVWRDHHQVMEGDPGEPGYPYYWEGDLDDGSALISIRLINNSVAGVGISFMVMFMGGDDLPMFDGFL